MTFLYVVYNMNKNFYRPIKNHLVKVLHLGTKKIYFGQKKPNCFKKSQNWFFDNKFFCAFLF